MVTWHCCVVSYWLKCRVINLFATRTWATEFPIFRINVPETRDPLASWTITIWPGTNRQGLVPWYESNWCFIFLSWFVKDLLGLSVGKNILKRLRFRVDEYIVSAVGDARSCGRIFRTSGQIILAESEYEGAERKTQGVYLIWNVYVYFCFRYIL